MTYGCVWIDSFVRIYLPTGARPSFQHVLRHIQSCKLTISYPRAKVRASSSSIHTHSPSTCA
jgi:hypothetical protein